MKNLTKFLYKTFLSLSIIIIILYGTFLYIIPPIANSVKIACYIEEFIYNKTGIEVKTDNLNVKTNIDLSADIFIRKIQLKDENKEISIADNVFLKIYPNQIKSIKIDSIYIDNDGINNLVSKKDKKKTKKTYSIKIPDIDVKLAEITYNKDNYTTKILIKNIKSKIEEELITTYFNAEIISTYLKNKIIIENNENILFKDNGVILKNLILNIGNSFISADGIIEPQLKRYEVKIKGENIPIEDVESSSLYYLKLRKPGKNFLENFTDFKGTANADLTFRENGINGKCLIQGLQAKTVMFLIPIVFRDFYFYFTEDEIAAEAYGLFGNEKVYADFKLSNYINNKKEISGRVHSILTNKFSTQYIKDLEIDGKIDANLRYYIKNSIPQITYLIKIPINSDLKYKEMSLELTNKIRRLFVRTKKDGTSLYIENYDYSTIEDSGRKEILSGNGLFKKENDKMHLKYITCKTKEYAPVSVTGSFGKKLQGGAFYGDIKYDDTNKLLTGNFNLKESRYKDFYVNDAEITADEKLMTIEANGTYSNSPFNANIEMENKFQNTITINKMDLFLDNFNIKSSHKKNKIKPVKKPEDLKFIIKQGRLRLNKITRKRIFIENIEILGNLQDDIVSFSIPMAEFANGILNASGQYNIEEHSSIINFSATNIDSNKVADMIFNLPGQISGTASASLHAITKDNLNHIKAKAKFSIKDGYLPKIGSTEFIIKRSKQNKEPLKVKFSDIINIDISKSKALSSDLCGSFDINNHTLDNVQIFSKQKYLSLFIEGNYNIDKENAHLELFGNYNKNAQKRVKILFIPLSIITKIIFKPEYTKEQYKNKIKDIPPINATEEETETFRVKMDGNLNKNDIKVELKSIK